MNGEFDQRFRNCQSHRSFFRMRWHQPSASALSVPGRSGSQYLAVRPGSSGAVHRDEGVGATGDVHHGTGGVVVVRLRRSVAPLHELRGVVDPARMLTRPARCRYGWRSGAGPAHLVGGHDVRRAEQKQRHAGIGLHAPLTAVPHQVKGGLVAVLRGDLRMLSAMVW